MTVQPELESRIPWKQKKTVNLRFQTRIQLDWGNAKYPQERLERSQLGFDNIL